MVPARREATAYRVSLLLDRCYRELRRAPSPARGAQVVRRIEVLEAIDRAWRAGRPFNPAGL